MVKRVVAPPVSLQAVDELLVTGTKLRLAVGPAFTGDQTPCDSVLVRLCQGVAAFLLQLCIAVVMYPTAPISTVLGGPLTPPATVTAVEAVVRQGGFSSHLLNHRAQV